MSICSALLKYGDSNFQLEILEYCDPDEAIIREQYYLDLLKPEYNILRKAGSLLGFRHSDETLAKFKIRSLGQQEHIKRYNSSTEHLEHLKRLHESSEHKEQLKRLHDSLKGKPRPEEAGSPSVPVEVFDPETGIKTIYPSMSAVAQALGVPSGSIRMYFSRNTQKPFKGRYVLQKLAG
jgi:group I intron endonuclease